MLIDTHLHLDTNSDFTTIIEEAYQNNVKKLIISGCDKKGIIGALKIASQYDNVYVTIGFHPSEADITSDSDIRWLEQLVRQNEKVIGLGEIGLDYYYGKDNKEKQLYLFKRQLQLAEKLNIPVVIHSRDAVEDTYELLSEFPLKGIIHCFGGSIEVAKLYIKLGYCLGIGGVVTFNNSKLSDTVLKIPLDFIVLETDSPYLAPVPYRGQTNYPKLIPIIAKKIAEIKNISPEEVEKITASNVARIFDLKI